MTLQGGNDSGLDVYAALTNRDGIAGSFPGTPYAALPLQPLDDVSSMRQWEPWIRAHVLDVEAMQGLVFEVVRHTGFRLAHSGNGGTTGICTVHRPADTTAMSTQLRLVADWAEIRQDRATEIQSQTSQLLTYWAAICGLQAERCKRTLELMGTLLRTVILIEVRFKQALAFPRPYQLSPAIQPIIQTPGHSSFPSGHSTEAHAMACFLARLIPPQVPGLADMLDKQAARIAINRTVAGVHYPMDSRAGLWLGRQIASYLCARCGHPPAAGLSECIFDAAQVLDLDFTGPADDPAAGLSWAPPMPVAVPVSPLLRALWSDAQQEW